MRKPLSKDICPAIANSALFAGISGEDCIAMLTCLGAYVRSFDKGEAVFNEGDEVSYVGLVARGCLHLTRVDVWGNNSIVAVVDPPGMFAESIVCCGERHAPMSAIAREASDVLFIDYKRIVTTCSSACGFHSRLIRNMIQVLARSNIAMSMKLEHVSRRTTREKLLSYLGDVAKQKGSDTFNIPLDRQELADYLSVDRSALSCEMSRMRRDGLIEYKKSRFKILKPEF
jgi:CRP-like cAMP-binding protein